MVTPGRMAAVWEVLRPVGRSDSDIGRLARRSSPAVDGILRSADRRCPRGRDMLEGLERKRSDSVGLPGLGGT